MSQMGLSGTTQFNKGADMAALFELLRNGAIHPVVIGREPLAAAKNVHARIDAGGLGGKVVLLSWLESR
jgi:NADPH:quinone reductase-like Zn-dependent oxidoreductase